MVGYIGSKAVTLSTTAADVTGDATINGNLTVNGTTVTIDSAAAQEIRLGDNDKMTFGDATGGDLQIYHDGANSYISELGTGDLRLGGVNIRIGDNTSGASYIYATQNAEVTLYHNNSAKLATTSTGIDVTGGVTADGYSYLNGLRVSGADTGNTVYQQSGDLSISSASGSISLKPSGTNILHATNTGVGIGTTSPSASLDVAGNNASGAIAEFRQTNSSNEGSILIDSPTNSDLRPSYLRLARGGTNEWTIGGVYGDTSRGVHFYDHSSSSTRMIIQSGGSVGIGTSSPSRQVSLYGTLPAISFQTSSTGTTSGDGFQVQVSGTEAYLWNYENSRIYLGANNSHVMQIGSNANVGIGTGLTAPAEKLHIQGTNPRIYVEGDANSYYPSIRVTGQAGGISLGTYYGGNISGENGIEFLTGSSATDSGTRRMKLDSNGNLGINTTTPNNYYAKKLVIDVSSDVQNGMTIVSGTSGSGMIAFADGTSGAAAYRGYFNYNHNDDSLVFGTGGSEVMRIDSSGRAMVGTNSANQSGANRKFSVIDSSFAALFASDNASQETFTVHNRATGGTRRLILFKTNGGGGTSVGEISSNGSSTTYGTSSDYRLKENVTDVTDGITRVKQLAPKRFNFIAHPDVTVDGFLAHEAQAVVPEAVTGTQDAIDAEGNPDYQGIDQSKLVPLLTAALQEAIAKIETLETEMTSVKARLDVLEGN
jgi:hypothetical protein